jgi:heat shock protein HtpX
MAMFKRIGLFLLTNILVMLTISIIINLLGIRPYITAYGIDYTQLMAFCAVWGMGGAFISLLMSKFMAKMFHGVQIVDANASDPAVRQLVQTVHRLAQSASLPKPPEVGIYVSPELNAFATGPTKGNSLVAVSTGLLQSMNRQEVEGVLGHEIAHIANGDMVTMTLIQGVVNAFVMFFARIAAWTVANMMGGRGDGERSPSYLVYSLMTVLFDIAFGILGSLVVCWFSRHREYRADKGGATLAGRDKMVAALEALKGRSRVFDNRAPTMAALKISSQPKGFVALLMTHPPLEERIQRLRQFQG